MRDFELYGGDAVVDAGKVAKHIIGQTGIDLSGEDLDALVERIATDATTAHLDSGTDERNMLNWRDEWGKRRVKSGAVKLPRWSLGSWLYRILGEERRARVDASKRCYVHALHAEIETYRALLALRTQQAQQAA